MREEMSYKSALLKVAKVCVESSEYSRRTQLIHETVMLALGLTHNQRAERHTKALQRSEAYKESLLTKSKGAAKRELAEAVKQDTGEDRQRINAKVAEGYIDSNRLAKAVRGFYE